MKIGQLARQANVSVETLRFYEREGLLQQPPRNSSGYREFQPADVGRLHFIQRARQLGFTLREIGELIDLQTAGGTDCAVVRDTARAKLALIDRKIAELERMRRELGRVVEACQGGTVADCAIMTCLTDENC